MKMSPKILGHMRVDVFSGEFRARLDFVAFPSPPSACLSNLTSAGNLSQTTLDDTLGQYRQMLRDALTYMNARRPVARGTAYEEMVKPQDDSSGRWE